MIRVLILILWMLTVPGLAFSMVSAVDSGGGASTESDTAESNLIGAPLFISTPAFGNGLGAVGIYLYELDKTDEISPKSSVGLVGMYSNTDSFFTGLFNQSYLKEDTWRVSGALISGKINNQLDITGFGDVRFATRAKMVGAKAEKRVKGDVFLGGLLAYQSIDFEEGNAASGD